MCVCLCAFVSVCTQHRSETGWTAAAVEGTGKETGGKGVAAACWPPHPLPLPQGAIKHTLETTSHTFTHVYAQIWDPDDKVRADHYCRRADLLVERIIEWLICVGLGYCGAMSTHFDHLPIFVETGLFKSHRQGLCHYLLKVTPPLAQHIDLIKLWQNQTLLRPFSRHIQQQLYLK